MEAQGIRRKGLERSVDRDHVYFGFPDRSFSYNCVECGSKCCRGHGYLMGDHERLYQLQRRPSLRFFMTHGGDVKVANAPPACFFLSRDGLCDIQSESGFDAKPETCRLFPFNRICAVGEYLVVTPHESLCPLAMSSSTQPCEESSHDALFATMRTHGLSIGIPSAEPIVRDIDRLIQLERRIAESVAQFRGRSFFEFVEYQAELTRLSGLIDIDEEATARTDAYLMMASFWDLLDAKEADLGDAGKIDDLMLTMTPSLRASLVFRETSSAHVDCIKHITLDLVPVYLLLIRLFGQLAGQAGMREITFQTIMRLVTSFHSLWSLLTFVNVQLVWRPASEFDLYAPAEPEFQRALIGVAKALTNKSQSARPLTLGEVLREHNEWVGVNRIRFLNFISVRLHGKIQPLKSAAAKAPVSLRSVRNALRHWVVASFDVQSLESVAPRLGADRRARKKR